MTKRHAFPSVARNLEREAVPEHVVDYIHGMLLPYHVAWDSVYNAITSPENGEAETSTQDRFLSTEEIGELLHVSRVTIHRYKVAGKIRAHKLGRRNLYSLAEVMAVVKGKEVANV